MSEDAITEAALAQGRTFVWHEVYGPNTQGLVDFYTQALDFGVSTMPMGEMGDYTMLVANGRPVAGVVSTGNPPNSDHPAGYWFTYIGVANCDEKVAKCLSLGAKLLSGPLDVPTVGRMALIQDPQGANFWLFEPAMS